MIYFPFWQQQKHFVDNAFISIAMPIHSLYSKWLLRHCSLALTSFSCSCLFRGWRVSHHLRLFHSLRTCSLISFRALVWWAGCLSSFLSTSLNQILWFSLPLFQHYPWIWTCGCCRDSGKRHYLLGTLDLPLQDFGQFLGVPFGRRAPTAILLLHHMLQIWPHQQREHSPRYSSFLWDWTYLIGRCPQHSLRFHLICEEGLLWSNTGNPNKLFSFLETFIC